MANDFDNVTVPNLDDRGVLTQFVQVKTDNAGWYNRYTRKFTLKFKGPTSGVSRLDAFTVYIGGTAFKLGAKVPTFSNSFIIYNGLPPVGSKDAWYVDSINVSHSDGGDQSIVEIVCFNDYKTGGGFDPEADDPAESESEAEDNAEWSLTWNNMNASVLIYAKEGANGAEWNRFIVNEQSLPAADVTALKNDIEMIPAFKACATSSNHTDKYTSNKYEFVRGPAVYQLKSDPEIRQLYEYYVKGENPVLHYPVLTQRLTWKGDSVDIDAGDIDTIGLQPNGHPFTGLDDYEWLLVDCSGTVNKVEGTCTKTRVWWGSLWDWNRDFYGDNRWFPGEIPHS